MADWERPALNENGYIVAAGPVIVREAGGMVEPTENLRQHSVVDW